MEKHVVLLSDGTVGTINPDTIDYQDVDGFIGEEMTVHLNDENGNPIERTGILEAVL